MSHLCPLPLPTLLRQRFMRQHNHLTHHVGLRQRIVDRVSISHVMSHLYPLPTLLRQRFMRQHNHPTHHVGLHQHILHLLSRSTWSSIFYTAYVSVSHVIKTMSHLCPFPVI